MRCYVDSDILIWHLRGEKKAARFLKKLKKEPRLELWIGAMQRAEILFFTRPHEEEQTMLFLSQFRTAPVDERIIDLAAQFYRRWNPSRGVDISDAILAATAAATGGRIYTLNKKHYPMREIVVAKAW